MATTKSSAIDVKAVQEAPTFYPTLEEWTKYDPIAYIEEVVRPIAEKAGICKIVPPTNWRPPFEADKTRYRLATRVQPTYMLEGKARVRVLFDEKVRKSCFLQGVPLERQHKGMNRNWLGLFKEVMSRGGADKVSELNQWDAVAAVIINKHTFQDCTARKLSQMYEDCLRPFEEEAKKPEPSKKSISPQKVTKRAKRAELFSPEEMKALHEDCGKAAPKPEVGAKFWKWVGDKGVCYRGEVKQAISEGRGKFSYIVEYRSGKDAFTEHADEDYLGLALLCGVSEIEAREAVENGVCQRCNRAHLTESILECDSCDWRFHSECLPEKCRSRETKSFDWFCPFCLEKFIANQNGHTEMDEAEDQKNANLAVLRQGMEVSPASIVIGLNEMASFGFPDGDKVTREEFQHKDENFRDNYERKVGKKIFAKESLIEDEFWRIAKGETFERIRVNYANDLNTGSIGSGFPTLDRVQKSRAKYTDAQRKVMETYASSPWNLTNFPTSNGSLLRHIGASISGVIVPWLYMGMTFSAFCFHVEDHNFASINYHHHGAPKSWWGVPSWGADKFETAARELCPELFEARPDLLQAIVTHYDPNEMVRMGVPMFHLIQRPGEFVITFPRAYHGGFNHGFNTAEAVNFASRSWFQYGPQAVERYAILHRSPIIAYEALMLAIAGHCAQEMQRNLTAGKHGDDLARTVYRLSLGLIEILEKENKERETLVKRLKIKPVFKPAGGVADQFTLKTRRSDDARREVSIMGRIQSLSTVFDGIPRCFHCKRFCTLSHGREGKRIFCLAHALSSSAFFESYSLSALVQIIEQLSRVAMPAFEWTERAVRLVLGRKQPDARIGQDEAGGEPIKVTFGTQPKSNSSKSKMRKEHNGSDLFAKPMILNSLTEWKVKPSLVSTIKLLALKGVTLVDESAGLRVAVDEARRVAKKCTKIFSSKVINSNDLRDVHDELMACAVSPDNNWMQKVSALLGTTVAWRRAVTELLNESATYNLVVPIERSLSMLETLLKDWEDHVRVDMPELGMALDCASRWRWIVQSRMAREKCDTDAANNLLSAYVLLPARVCTSPQLEELEVDALKDMLFDREASLPVRIQTVLSRPVFIDEVSALVGACHKNGISHVDNTLKAITSKLSALEKDLKVWLNDIKHALGTQTGIAELRELMERAKRLNVSEMDPAMVQLMAVIVPLEGALSELEALGSLEPAGICVCGLPPLGILVECKRCTKIFHSSCMRLRPRELTKEFVCFDCERSSRGCCYREDVADSKEQVVECRLGFNLKCVDSMDHHRGDLDREHAAKLCSEGKCVCLNSTQESAFIVCNECGTKFHLSCIVPQRLVNKASELKSWKCFNCTSPDELDMPRTPLGDGVGYLAMRDEIDRRALIVNSGRRPDVDHILRIKAYLQIVPDVLVPSEMKAWIHAYDDFTTWLKGLEAIESMSDIGRWSVIEKLLQQPFEPRAIIGQDCFASLFLNELWRIVESDSVSLKQLCAMFASDRDEAAFAHLCSVTRSPKGGEVLKKAVRYKSWLDNYKTRKAKGMRDMHEQLIVEMGELNIENDIDS